MVFQVISGTIMGVQGFSRGFSGVPGISVALVTFQEVVLSLYGVAGHYLNPFRVLGVFKVFQGCSKGFQERVRDFQEVFKGFGGVTGVSGAFQWRSR